MPTYTLVITAPDGRQNTTAGPRQMLWWEGRFELAGPLGDGTHNPPGPPPDGTQ
jgi:hypothetical protein